MSRPPLHLEEVCSRFDLGSPAGIWEAVDGGLSNELHKLRTNRGDFAVKRMIAGTHRAEFETAVEASFRIERAAVNARISAPTPVTPQGSDGCLAMISCGDGSTSWVRVHEWVEGTHVTPTSISARVAEQVGETIASVHALDIRDLGLQPFEEGNDRDWSVLQARVEGIDTELARALEEVIAVVATQRSQRPNEASAQVVAGHRDADPKNALIGSDGTLMLLDWDAAGPIEPGEELTSLLLDWSGELGPEEATQVGRALGAGYRRVAKSEPTLDASGWIEGQLGWIAYNLERALGDHGPDAVSLGSREAAASIARLNQVGRNLETLLASWRGQ